MSRTTTIIGVILLLLGMAIDLYQHGVDFLIREFTEAPWAHGLPIAGITLIIIGVVLGIYPTRRE